MKTSFILIPLFLVIISCQKTINDAKELSSSSSSSAITSYKLVWADEFNYTGLPDSNYWTYETGYVRNNESQYYVARRLANSRVQNGSLTIAARNDNYQHHPITSASVITKGKRSFLYGKIEVRAKMPVGAGAWPAIWTLGTNRNKVGWPFCGEIDILEWLGRAPQYIFGSLYTANSSGQVTSKVTPYSPQDYATLSSKYHVYSIEWDSTKIRYFYDGINYVTYRASDMTATEWQPFKKPQYLLLNLAIGGTAGGTIDSTKFPFIYKIDYVRYYKMRN